MIRYRIMVDGEIRDATLMAWAQWFDTDARFVAFDTVVSDRYGTISVSTIFLGIEMPDGCWFESKITRERGVDRYDMPPPDDVLCRGFWGEMTRWRTLDEARAGHADLLAKVRDLASAEVSIRDDNNGPDLKSPAADVE